MTSALFRPAHDLDDRQLRMLVGSVFDGGDLRATASVAQVGPHGCWDGVCDGQFGPGIQGRAAEVDLARLERAAFALSLRFVVPGDLDWPVQLDDLAEVESPVDGRGGVPVGLWVRGHGDLAGLARRSVAVVGARACTPYGARVAHDLGYDLAAQRVTVVSGLAMGIDVAAHRGALVDDGPTVAVLACGVDVVYPRSNEAVYRRIVDRGLVVSEVRPGTGPTKVGFLARNRLIAALSQGTVLVEAALRSGARNTVSWAGAAGRAVMAVPGSVESAWSQGPHAAIRDQQAILVTRAAEVLEVVAPLGTDTLASPRGERRPIDDLDPLGLAVHDALTVSGGRSVGEVAVRSGMAVPACLTVLSRLESLGLAEPDTRGWRLARIPATRTPAIPATPAQRSTGCGSEAR